MPQINGCKFSCEPCLRGHRASSCAHTDRVLVKVRKPGRPLETCAHQLSTCCCGRLDGLFSPSTIPLEQSPNHHSLLDSVVERRISYTRREETEPRIKHGYSITKRPANRRKTPTSSSIDHLKRTKPDPVTSISTLLQNCSENTSPRLQAWTTVPNPAPATSGQFFTDGTNTDRSEQRRRDVGQTHNGGSPYRFSSIIEIAPSHGGLHKSENGRQGPSTFVG